MAALETYLTLLTKWQARINLVSRTTLADPWRRHFLDSAQLVPYLPEKAACLADLGSGAGFPGLVLAIITGKPIHLVESDQRKSIFMREVARETGAPVIIHTNRIEKLSPLQADVITSRALASLPKLIQLSLPHLKNDGILLFLKGKNVAFELTESRKNWKLAAEAYESRTDPDGRVLLVREIFDQNGRKIGDRGASAPPDSGHR
ncbi:16S rRNA (guanine(527)-N(7))-methyltransferase RsmG [Magnetospira sp. QH-2]|uniref:16S rRNA (guanine(527)-N(7))-methyltransferase RsmG n=1 Tax=Magnetospira sp. (strain QH-2) TaxID=1288970 RepID=UPI0005F9D97A|nr:16S rRNA (guanine(527)-N(7))-methyltransferase RsmG [Magnetospira sp. QH-2]